MAIPPRIINVQMDFSGEGRSLSLRPLAKAAVANLKLLHPDWEHLFFDDRKAGEFVRREFPEYERVFGSLQFPIQKVDFFRYLAVYRLGGFYFDLDVLLSEKLDDLLSHDCVFPFEDLNWNPFLRSRYGMDWNVGNYGFGAASGSPFLKAVIDNCCRAIDDRAWFEQMMRGINFLLRPEYQVLNSTGPGLVSRTLAENAGGAAAAVHVLFPDDVRDQGNWHLFGRYGVHLMNAGWRKQSYLWSRLAWRWETYVWDRAVALSVSRGPTRSVQALASTDA